MNRALLRGLAALILAGLLPRLGATVLTVSQSAGGTAFSAPQNAWNGSLGFVSSVALFDESLGTLTAVSLTASTTATVITYERNEWAQAVTYTPQVFLLTTVSLAGVMPALATDSDMATGSPILLQPQQNSPTFSPAFANTLTFESSDPTWLASFTGIGSKVINVRQQYDGLTTFGVASASGTASFTLTYHYQTSDGGSTLALAAPLFLLALLRHRRKSSL